jgi:hypothetical protein
MPGTGDLQVTAPNSTTSERWANATGGGGPPAEKSAPQLLNEMLARLGMGPANFEVTHSSGLPNAMTFVMELKLFGQVYSGTAKSKKAARTLAAEAAVADQKAWYEPNMRHKEQAEEEEEQGTEDLGEEGEGEEKEVQDVDRGEGDGDVSDRGQLPGSYPS